MDPDSESPTTITMNKEEKLKNASIVDDEGQVITKDFSLTICLKAEDDFPHPRHLCLIFPFGKSSPKKYCNKCYCYVCEEIAPCKMWKKSPKRHCDATDKDAKWKSERKLKKQHPGSTTMAHHKLIVSASNLFPNEPGVPRRGIFGGLICNNDDKWIVGISMHLRNNIDPYDYTLSFYIALLEGLELAWSKGLRYLDVKLGFVIHNDFWTDFTKDAVTGKLRFSFNQVTQRMAILKSVEDYFNRELRVSFDQITQRMPILKSLEDYFNREWFLDVKNSESIEEESGAFMLSTWSKFQGQTKGVYDFRTHPVPSESRIRSFVDEMREVGSLVSRTPADRKYFGLN